MGRCRIVEPKTVRLHLVDVHKRALATIDAEIAEKGLSESRIQQREQLAARLEQAIEDADFIDVKKQLSAGEVRNIYAGMVEEQKFGSSASVNPKRVGLTKIMEYLVGWSFVDRDGGRLPVSESALLSFDPDTFHEINEAIDFHQQEMERAATDRKKTTAGDPMSSPTSTFAVQ